MNFSKKKKFFQLWKALVIAHLAVFIFACPAASDTSSNSNDKSPLDETKLKVARITAEHGDVLSADSGFANGDYESVEFIKGHKVTSIEKGAFEGNKISKITIPKKIVHLGKNAFKGNPLTEVTFKGNVETIEEGALATTEDSLKVILEEDIDGFKEGSAFAAEKIADALGDKDKTVKFEKSANTKQAKSSAVDTLIVKITTKVAAIKSLKKVTFDSKDGSFVNPKFVVSGQLVTEPAKPTKEGNGFVGWYAAEDLTGSAYNFLSETVSEDTTLYAKWDSTIVTIESVSITSSPSSGQNGYYKENDKISIKLTFTEVVTTASNPAITMKTSSGDIALVYDSVNTTGKEVVFTYTVGSTTDFSKIYIKSFTLTGGGTIKYDTTTPKDVSLTYAGKLFDIKVDGVAPTIAGVAFAGEAKAYKTGEKIAVEVTFSEAVTVDTNSGTNIPFITVQVGDNDRNAKYAGDGAKSIKHTFEYAVESGDDDKDGIAILLNSFRLNGGTIKDAAGNELDDEKHTAVAVDSARTVTTASQASDGSSELKVIGAVLKDATTETTYKAGQKIVVEVTFSENVNVDTSSDNSKPFIKLQLGGNGEKKAEYKSGHGTSKLTFEYRVKNDDTATAYIEILANSLDANNPGTLQNSGGTNFDLSHVESINTKHTVDAIAPRISRVEFGGPNPENNFYKLSDEIQVNVTFREAVTVDTNNGTNKPFIQVQVGSNQRNAEYADDGMSKNTHIFKYRVASGDDDKDGIAILLNSFRLNRGTITDAAGNILTVESSPAVSINSNRKVNADDGGAEVADTTAPTIHAVEFGGDTPPLNLYKLGNKIQVNVIFTEDVTVDISDGIPPYIQVRIGENDRNAEYDDDDGMSKSTHTFTYRVASDDSDNNGIEVIENSFKLNSGTITDTADNDLTSETNPAVGIESNRKVDGIVPTIRSVAFGGDASNDIIYKTREKITVEVTFIEEVGVYINSGTRKPYIQVRIGENDRKAEYAGDHRDENITHIFEYTVENGDKDADGIEVVENSFSLNGALIRDAANNILTDEDNDAVAQDNNRLVNVLPRGDTLQFFDDTSKALLSGVNIADGSGESTSDAKWINNKATHAGNSGFGVVVDAAENKAFTLSPKVTPVVGGDHSESLAYSVARYEYDHDSTSNTAEVGLGDPVSEVLEIDSGTGEITLKDATKGGRYVITVKKAGTATYRESVATYTLWVMVESSLTYPDVPNNALLQTGESSLFASRADVFKYQHLIERGRDGASVVISRLRKIEVVDEITEDGQQIVVNADAFTFVFGKHENDLGSITYALKPAEANLISDGAGVLTVNTNTGRVTVDDASKLLSASNPYVIVGTKAEWEYFKSDTKEYSISK